ncbi:11698_t:CDS:2, partial [Gigaspora margarita]
SIYNCYAALVHHLRENTAIQDGVSLWDQSSVLTSDKCFSSCLNNTDLEKEIRTTCNIKILNNIKMVDCNYSSEKKKTTKIAFFIDNGENKLKKMLFLILKLRKITNQCSAIIILKAADVQEDKLINFLGHRSREASNNDREEFYSYPDKVYTNYESEIDNENENINKTKVLKL